MARVALDLPQQQLLRLVGGEAGDTFELVLLLRDQALVLAAERRGRLFATSQAMLACVQIPVEPLERILPLGQAEVAPGQRLLECRGGLTDESGLALGACRGWATPTDVAANQPATTAQSVFRDIAIHPSVVCGRSQPPGERPFTAESAHPEHQECSSFRRREMKEMTKEREVCATYLISVCPACTTSRVPSS